MSTRHPFSSPDSTPDDAPRHAATVVLVRDGAEGLEVLLLKRHGKSAFMADAWVYPGGKLEGQDQDEAIRTRLADGAAEDCARRLKPTPGYALSEAEAVGLFIAGCRELFEEAGVLLARRPGADTWLGLTDDDEAARFDAYRHAVHEGEQTFLSVLETEDLVLDPTALAYLAHWITPSFENRRFDTRFFLCHAPAGQRPLIDAKEAVDGGWRPVREVLAQAAEGEVFLAPPTLLTLTELSAHENADAAADFARGAVVNPILPRVGLRDGSPMVMMPWDVGYADAQGEALEGVGGWREAAGPSRVYVEDGVWKTERVTEA